MMLNISKWKESVIDFAKEKRTFQPLFVDGIPINRVESSRILGLTVQKNMKWNYTCGSYCHERKQKALSSEVIKKKEPVLMLKP